MKTQVGAVAKVKVHGPQLLMQLRMADNSLSKYMYMKFRIESKMVSRRDFCDHFLIENAKKKFCLVRGKFSKKKKANNMVC